MYVRFTIRRVDERSHEPMGIFRGAYHLIGEGTLSKDEDSYSAVEANSTGPAVAVPSWAVATSSTAGVGWPPWRGKAEEPARLYHQNSVRT
jgi:hypothetical protein